MKAELALDIRDHLGEGILWDDRDQVLWWLNVPMPSRLHRWNPITRIHNVWDMPEMITSMAVRQKGGLIIASHHGINFFDPETGRLERVLEPEKQLPGNRCNDGACDRQGRFWVGTMQNNISLEAKNLPLEASSGSLYRINPDLSFERVETDIMISNTVCWSPDNTVFYFTDTVTEVIRAYNFDTQSGSISNSIPLLKGPLGSGYPDGSTVDAQGGIWSCRWEGGSVIRFFPNGEVDQVVEVPVSRVTSCTFGGAELDTLFITTARWDMTEAELVLNPEAGGLFRVKPGFKGMPDARFAG
jgi:sugar lactone lactonase YvrE